MLNALTRLIFAIAMLFAVSGSALASFHLWHITQVYSNADGSIQFVQLQEGFGANGQEFLAGHALTSTQGATTNTLIFPSNLPSGSTANRSVLIATAGFAALGAKLAFAER